MHSELNKNPGFMFRIVIFLILVPYLSSAQFDPEKLSTHSKTAARNYTEAAAYYNSGHNDMSISKLQKAIEDDPKFVEAWLLLGDVYSDEGEAEQAINAYSQGVLVNPNFHPAALIMVARLEMSIGRYEDANKHLRKYKIVSKGEDSNEAEADKLITNCDFALKQIANPVPFHPENLGDSINGPLDEYINAISVDNSQLYITQRHGNAGNSNPGRTDEDFYVSYKNDGHWGKIRNVGNAINTDGNEGALSLSPDGMYLLFAACHREDSYGSCDIYLSRKRGGKWGRAVNLGPVINTVHWESHPCLAPDGKTLYFVSTRPGGSGKADIWKSVYQSNHRWGDPVNLGTLINTNEDEMSPYIHPDGVTLYFSSSGHPGMGGMDMYVTHLDESGNWSKPENIGYPLNTFADEIDFIVDASSTKGYISSNKLGGYGGEDVYSFEIYEEIRPNQVTYLKGVVYNAENNQRVSASFNLIDLETGEVVVESFSDDESGEFLVCIPVNREYALNISKDGFLFYSEHYEFEDQKEVHDPYLVDIPLKPLRKGESVVLKNIFFETDSYTLLDQSRVELSKLLSLLKTNTRISIEISGHTDNQGGDEYNMILSENRARAVFNYLVENGISENRLSYVGYGFHKPIDTNDTEKGRSKNRRTEFKIISD